MNSTSALVGNVVLLCHSHDVLYLHVWSLNLHQICIFEPEFQKCQNHFIAFTNTHNLCVSDCCALSRAIITITNHVKTCNVIISGQEKSCNAVHALMCSIMPIVNNENGK